MERASDEGDPIPAGLTPFPGRGRQLSLGLPSPAAPLVGRANELAALGALLADPAVRLITLTGPGGVGKTRLAIELARHMADAFVDGVAFVGLADVRDPLLVATTIAQRLGIEALSDRPAGEILIDALRSRTMLLVIDNLEHLLPATPLLADLLATAPHVKILATSRGRLRLSGERDVPVAPLAVPGTPDLPPFDELAAYGAIRLWCDRAEAANPRFRLTPANAAAVAEICRRLDGLPLAIELAAAWSRLLSPDAVLNRLERRLHLLTDGPRDAPVRLQTMRAAIAWSFDLLDAAERALFVRLSVFTGGFTFEGAEAVGGKDGEGGRDEVLGLVSSLMDKGLLHAGTNAEGAPRLAMLETVREFGLEQLAAAGAEDAAREAHTAYCLAFVEAAAPGLEGPDQLVWFNRIEAEVGNIRVALAWLRDGGRIEEALRLAGALAWFWTAPTYVAEGRAWYDTLLAAPGAVTPAVRAKALGAAGDLADWHTDAARATALHEEALALWRAAGDRGQTAATLRSLGSAAIDRGEPARAEAVLSEALALARQVGDRWNEAAASNLLGVAVLYLSDWRRAVPLHEAAIRLWRDANDSSHVGTAFGSLGWAYLLGGDGERAWDTFEAALTLAERTGDEVGVAWCLVGFAGLAAGGGALTAAVRLAAAAATLRDRLGTPPRPPNRAVLARWVGEWEIALGGPAFVTAWSAGRSLGQQAAIAEARAVPRPMPVVIGRPAGLSPREVEVLRLLVEGAADAEIAERLFITRKTASKHVAAIIEKLGVANRTAAVSAAIRRGLV